MRHHHILKVYKLEKQTAKKWSVYSYCPDCPNQLIHHEFAGSRQTKAIKNYLTSNN